MSGSELDWLNDPVAESQDRPNETPFALVGKMPEVIERFLRWGHSHSVWPFGFGLACCGIEMVAAAQPHFDLARFGSEVFRPSPRQADLMIVSGTVTEKMAPLIRRLYDQMPEPKYVIAMGACASTGGPYWNAYNVVDGVHKLIPVDVYVPGCPPRPEALIQGLMEIQEMIRTGERGRITGEHRGVSK